MENKERFLVIGSNNFWYGLTDTLKDAKEVKKDILSGNNSFGDPESNYNPEKPYNVYIYKAVEIN